MNTQHFFQEIVSLENLFLAWNEFVKGKRYKKDVAEFSLGLSENIYDLYRGLKDKTYIHGGYHAFNISDPKPRNIHKATVRDRILHQAIYRVLYPYFDTKFIHDSYSCRVGKGTHKSVMRFNTFANKASSNNRKTLWILKCDVRKFFASIDQKRLLQILGIYNLDKDTIWLIKKVVESFNSGQRGKGLPLGNLTSQLLVNVYMDWFDQWIKHRLKVKYYIRYADDFVVMSTDRTELEKALVQIELFLKDNLLLDLHPDKVFIKTYSSGVDFLGWVNFPTRRVLRTTTKRRMIENLQDNPSVETVQSYLGLLRHGSTYKLISKIL
ncbi:MAG: reverse transcriptase/maturase family protein [Parcubacteria group bacterium]